MRRITRHPARAGSRPARFDARFERLEDRRLLSFEAGGEPFRINTGAGMAIFSQVAMDADGDSVFGFFQIEEDFSEGRPMARLYDAQGNPKGPDFFLNSVHPSDFQPAVDMDDAGNFAAAFLASEGTTFGGPFGVFVRRFDAAGNPLGAEFQVDADVPGVSGQGGIPYVDLAMTEDGGFVVVWKHTDDTGGLLYARRYGADNQPLGAAFRVDDPAQGSANLDAQVIVNDRDEVMVAWRRRLDASGAGDLYGRVLEFADDGTVSAAPQFLISGGGDHSSPSLAASRNHFFVSWRDSSGVPDGPQSVRVQRFGRHGNPLGGLITVDSGLPTVSVFHGPSRVDAAADGRFAVVWDRPSDQPNQVTAFVRNYDSEGLPETDPVQLATGADPFNGVTDFEADDDLSHGMLSWDASTDFAVHGQLVIDPSVFASATADGDADEEEVATGLVTA